MNAIRKYGKDSFVIELLIERDFESFSDAEIFEGSLIKDNQTFLSEIGYNLNYRKDDGSRYYVETVYEKIERNNIANNNPFFGKTHSDEVRKLLSNKAKLRFSKPENNPRYGYKFTEQDKEKWRKAKEKFGKPFSADGVIYNTLGEASRKFGLTKQAIQNRIRSSNYKDWYYI
jgi:group I intron endonuclease